MAGSLEQLQQMGAALGILQLQMQDQAAQHAAQMAQHAAQVADLEQRLAAGLANGAAAAPRRPRGASALSSRRRHGPPLRSADFIVFRLLFCG